MSEIAKCPVCGCQRDMDKVTFACLSKGCYFSCKLKDLPRISAAMDLAKAWSAKNKLSDDEMFKGPITEERLEQFKELNKRIDVSLARVLEVFK